MTETTETKNDNITTETKDLNVPYEKLCLWVKWFIIIFYVSNLIGLLLTYPYVEIARIAGAVSGQYMMIILALFVMINYKKTFSNKGFLYYLKIFFLFAHLAPNIYVPFLLTIGIAPPSYPNYLFIITSIISILILWNTKIVIRTNFKLFKYSLLPLLILSMHSTVAYTVDIGYFSYVFLYVFIAISSCYYLKIKKTSDNVLFLALPFIFVSIFSIAALLMINDGGYFHDLIGYLVKIAYMFTALILSYMIYQYRYELYSKNIADKMSKISDLISSVKDEKK